MIGQQKLKEVISRQVRPTIIVGPRGIGKLTLIKYLYPACNVIGDGKQNIKMDMIRPIIEQSINQTEDVYCFRNVDNMSSICQNALLKLLEECPEHLKIFLLCEDLNFVLQTIKSRCNTFKMPLYSDDEVAEYVTLKYPNLKKVDLFQRYCMGVIGKVDRLSGKVFKEVRDKCLLILQNLRKIKLGNIFNIIKHLEPYKEELELIIDTLIIMYNDVLLVKLNMEEDVVDYLLLSKYKDIDITVKQCVDSILILDSYKHKRNYNFTMLVDNLMIQLKEV